MAYDPQKAHEYYVKYRKKGLKKGRKKGQKKTYNLGRVFTANLNDDGKFEADLIKDRLKEEMNEALEDAETTEEKERIRRNFQEKAIAEIERLAADEKYAKPQKAKKVGSKALVGVSMSGLNDSGKMEAALIKDRLKTEMNEAMAEVETPEEKDDIRRQYQQKAIDEIQKLRDNPQYAKPQKEKAEKAEKKTANQSESGGDSGGKPVVTATSGKSSKSGSGKKKGSSSKNKSSSGGVKITPIHTEATELAESIADKVEKTIKTMTPEQKQEAKGKLEETLNELQTLYKSLFPNREPQSTIMPVDNKKKSR